MNILSSPLYFGPGRRSARTCLEQHIVLDEAEKAALSKALPGLRENLRALMKELQIRPLRPFMDRQDDDLLMAFSAAWSTVALSVQTTAGHRVEEKGACADGVSGGAWAWFEYEHDALAIPAAVLSYRLLSEAISRLVDGATLLLPEKLAASTPIASLDLEQAVAQFMEMAHPLVLPRDTETLAMVAERLDIPFQKLERLPYRSNWSESRVRRNGLVRLGHGPYQLQVDGTLCTDRNGHFVPELNDREALRARLVEAGFPVPARDPEAGNCMLTKNAIRAAGTLGYPVVIKTGERDRRPGVSVGVVSPEQVRVALDRARRVGNSVIVEARAPGKSHKVLVAAGEIMAVVVDDAVHGAEVLHPDTRNLITALAGRLDIGLMVLDIVIPDIRKPLVEGVGAVVDLELAPDLSRLQPAGSDLAERALEKFLRWLYPEGQPTRVPIVAVTGTNGKTTTSRMIAHIAQAAGHHTGLVCTDGVYVDLERIGELDEIGGGAYHLILERRDVDFAVPEEWFGRIVRSGFAYSRSNVGVCLNVTNDHIGRMGAHSIEQMAQVKEVVVAHARDGVVLNADDPNCLDMASRSRAARVGLVSSHGKSELPDLSNLDSPCFCTIEHSEGKDWLVISDGDDEFPVTPVDGIPATFKGAAAHNVSNAAHAALAAWLAGVPVEAIAAGLGSFAMNFETTPGRLNIHDGLPYRVILDYAHNDEGFRVLTEFLKSQPCQGRKIVMATVAGDRRDGDFVGAGAILAGHFDHYVCRNYSGMRGRPLNEGPALIRQGLMESGVVADAITTIEDNEEAIEFSLDMAEPGDLVVLLGGNDEFDLIWQKLQARGSGHPENEIAPGQREEHER